MEDEGPKTRVNGSMLQSHIGRNVCLIGLVSSVDSNGCSFKLTACDRQMINVRLQEPLQELVQGLVEVVCNVTGKSEVMCLNFLQFSDEMSNSFDLDLYNKAVTLTQKFSDRSVKI